MKKKPKLRKGEQVWWTMSKNGKLMMEYISKTKNGINFVYPYKTRYLSIYQPVKIIVRKA